MNRTFLGLGLALTVGVVWLLSGGGKAGAPEAFDPRSDERTIEATRQPRAAQPTTTPVARTPTPAPAEIEIISVATERDINDTLYVIGEIRNKASVPLAPQLQAIARNKAGEVVDTTDWWPASTGNIAAGDRWPIKYPLTSRADVETVSVRVITVRTR